MAPVNPEVGDGARNRKAMTGIAASALSRTMTALAPILVIPQSLGYLGASLYGAWASALSLTSLIAFSDLGIGTGLMTRLAAINPRDEPETARRLVSSAYAMASTIAGGLLLILWSSAPLLDWPKLIGAEGAAASTATEGIVLATLSAFLVMIPVGLIVRVQYGFGQVATSNLWQTVAAASSVGAVFLAVQLDPGAANFVAMAAFTPVLVGMLNSVWFFAAGPGRGMGPHTRSVSRETTRSLLGVGSRFLLIFVLLTIGGSLDTWIAARTVSLEAATTFQIPSRIMATIGVIVSVLSMPLWPLHAEAHANGDWRWMSRTTRRVTLITAGAVTGVMVLACLILPWLVPRWLGEDIPIPTALWWALAVWWLIQGLSSPAFMAQNGAEILTPQTIGYAIFAASMPLKWVACEKWGVVSLPIVSSLVFMAAVWPSCIVGYRRAIGTARLNQAARKEAA